VVNVRILLASLDSPLTPFHLTINPMSTRHLLLVEDNPDDAVLFQRALVSAYPDASLAVVPDVISASYYLRGEGHYADRKAFPFPYLVVIDLKLATVSGMELVKWIRRQPVLGGQLIILVLTASEDIRDAVEAYKQGANSFIIKQSNTRALADSLISAHERWLTRGLNLPVDPVAPARPASGYLDDQLRTEW
jgi:CheY-like chemotaxis protein